MNKIGAGNKARVLSWPRVGMSYWSADARLVSGSVPTLRDHRRRQVCHLAARMALINSHLPILDRPGMSFDFATS